MKAYAKLIILLLLILPDVVLADPVAIGLSNLSAKGLSKVQARQILLVVLEHEKHSPSSPGMYIESLTKKNGAAIHSGYYDFGFSYESPNAGATQTLGLFAISRFTGDVWELHLCRRYSFPKLDKLQQAIMQVTKKTFADEKKQRRGLGCTDE